jgi:hypothetical protein
LSRKTTFSEEIGAINKDLRSSYERLSALLEKSRKELDDSDTKLDVMARENLATVIGELEVKLGELKELGASHC